MRHRVKKTGLQKTRSKPKAMRRNLLKALFTHEAIQTTEGRATKIAPLAEKIVTAVKTKETREAIRYIAKYFDSPEVSKKAMSLKDKFGNKTSGFTSIHKIGYRDGDAAMKVQIKLNLK